MTNAARRMFQVMHEIPGRLRLYSRSLLRNPALARALEARLGAMPGVRAATASPRSGSVILLHDAAPGRSATLRAELGPMAPQAAPFGPMPGTAFDRLAAALLERAAGRLLGALAAALI